MKCVHIALLKEKIYTKHFLSERFRRSLFTRLEPKRVQFKNPKRVILLYLWIFWPTQLRNSHLCSVRSESSPTTEAQVFYIPHYILQSNEGNFSILPSETFIKLMPTQKLVLIFKTRHRIQERGHCWRKWASIWQPAFLHDLKLAILGQN